MKSFVVICLFCSPCEPTASVFQIVNSIEVLKSVISHICASELTTIMSVIASRRNQKYNEYVHYFFSQGEILLNCNAFIFFY